MRNYLGKVSFEEFVRVKEDGCTLPPAGVCHLQYLLDTYSRLANTASTTAVSANSGTIQALKARLQTDAATLCWPDLTEAELCLLDLTPDEDLKERLAGWRRRLREVIGDARYATYLAGASPDDSTDMVLVRSDLSQCIRTVYYFCTFFGMSARSRKDVSQRLLYYGLAILGALFLLSLAFLFLFKGQSVASYVLAASAAGVIGSVISTQLRMQDPKVDVDPIYRHIQLTGDWLSVSLFSPLSGAVFGAVMYALLASGLFQGGGVVPQIDQATLVPMTAMSTALVLVYAFVSGFFERLIPDTLSRLATKAEESKAETPLPAPSTSTAARSAATSNGVKQRAVFRIVTFARPNR